MIYWACKRCAEGLEAPECLAGDKLRCPKCKRLCRVPQTVEHHQAEVELVGAGASESHVADSNSAPAPHVNGHTTYESPNGDALVIEHHAADRADTPADFAVSRIGEDAVAVPESPEVPDSIAAEDTDPMLGVAAEDPSPLFVTTDDLIPAVVTQAASLEAAEEEVDVDIVIERVAADDSAHETTMDDLIADAMDRELAEHPPVEAAVEEPSPTPVAVAEATPVPQPIEETLTPEQELESSLEDLTPIIQRQLGPAIAQYSSREQAKAAMFARAIVDVYPIRLNVRSHEPGRVTLAVRYRRILRRTVIGTKTLPDMTVEATFIQNADTWSLGGWQRILAV